MAKKSKRRNKKHFSGKDPVVIHTGRTPKCDRGGACEYQETKTGRSPTLPGGTQKISDLALGKAQDHHVVPVSVLIAYRGDREVRPDYEGCIRFIDSVYRDQDYCANNAKNLVWLPTKATYAQNATSPKSPVFDLGLVCHTWGHPSYTKEVTNRAKALVWNPIKQAFVDGKKCPDPPDLVSAMFTDLQQEFSDELSRRAKRGPGSTRKAIEQAGQVESWWFPFSMADDGEASAEPAFAFAVSAKVPTPLLRLM